MTDFLEDALMHSWGKSPKQKAAEKRYNAEYYRRNKDKWKKYRENAKANMSQFDKNIEGAQTRHDSAARDYSAAKYKLNTLRNQYKKFLEGAGKVGANDKEIAQQRAAYQKDIEKAAKELEAAESNFNKTKANLDTQKSSRAKAQSNYDKTIKNDPFAKRAAKRANAAAANEAAKAARQEVRGIKARREKTRANANAENMAAQQQAAKNKNAAFKEKQKQEFQKISGEIMNATNKRAVIKKEMDEDTKRLKELNEKGVNKSGAALLAKNIQDNAEKVRALNDKIKELNEKKSKLV